MVNGKNGGREGRNALFQGVAGCGTGIDEHCDGQRGMAPGAGHIRGGVLDRWRKRAKAADEETLVLLKGFPGNPDVEKARAEFESAQKVEEKFHKDFDGVDFT